MGENIDSCSVEGVYLDVCDWKTFCRKNSKEERVLKQQKQRCKPGRCDTSKRYESLKAKTEVKEVNGKSKTKKNMPQTKQKKTGLDRTR